MALRNTIPVALCMLVGLASANPLALEPFDASGKLTVSLPKGWTVTADLDKGLIAAQQDPSRSDAAAVLRTVFSSFVGTTAGNGGAHQTVEKKYGTIALAPNMVLTLKSSDCISSLRRAARRGSR